MRTWPDGEVHLFWDAGLTSGGAIHVWKPAGGTWQKPEHWPIAYFGEILRGPDSLLHIGGIDSDGLDTEFMHWTWSVEGGLSDPENISRHIGDIGNASYALRFDSQGQLHAAWAHILDQKSAADPITGETPDISGVFYASRLPDGSWTPPEQLGTLAPYAHALGMEMDSQGHPLIAWQAEGGLVSRIKRDSGWDEPLTVEAVQPPETPAEFGPERWVTPTAELKTAVDSQGRILAGWLIAGAGILRMASWSDSGWEKPVDVLPPEDSSRLDAGAPGFEMVVDPDDQIHFTFFEVGGTVDYPTSGLVYAVYDGKQTRTHPLGVFYDGYGIQESSLQVDPLGSVAVLGLPRSPEFAVKLPAAGLPPTPSPTPSPTATPLSTFTPVRTPTPTRSPVSPVIPENFIPLLIGMVVLVVLIVLVVRLIRLRRH
jgi:hypothetical protein